MKYTQFLIISLWLAILCACGSANRWFETNNNNNTSAKKRSWVEKTIDSLKNQALQYPPAEIWQYIYNDDTVYYFSPPCCDQFSSVYNTKGMLICHPDGGFTGKGDGLCPDFRIKSRHETLVFKDERKKIPKK